MIRARFRSGLLLENRVPLRTYGNQQPGLTFLTGPSDAIGFEDSKKYVQTIRSELVYRFNWVAGRRAY